MIFPWISGFLVAPDTWERHAVTARLVGSPGTLLDVGGEGLLRRFLGGTDVTTANVEPAGDVVLAGVELPFPDDAFDAATSIDVLEHLPRDQRAVHVAELRRVARRTVVLCTPYGTPEHVAAERELAALHRYVDEHLRYGLATPAELGELASGAEVFYHGDFRRSAELLRLGVRRRPLGLARLALARLRPDLELVSTPSPFTNRAFARFTSLG